MAKRRTVEGLVMNGCWKGRRVLVTGATGLLGSWLVKALLERQTEVVALVLDAEPRSELYRSGAIQQVRVVNGRLEDYAALERAVAHHEVDTVFHFGAQAIVPVALRSPWATFEANVRGTYNLLEACRVHHDIVQRIVVASSDKAYGASGEPYREDMALQARHPYEASKACTEFLARSYATTYGLTLAITRCGNLYGGGDLNWSRIVPGTIRSLLAGERPVIRSNGRLVRDYLYVEDAVEACLRLAEQLERPEVRGEAFNISAETPRTVLEVVELLRRLLGCETIEPTVLNLAEGELESQVLSPAKANEVLGWKATWDLESGLQRTIEWYRALFLGDSADLKHEHA